MLLLKILEQRFSIWLDVLLYIDTGKCLISTWFHLAIHQCKILNFFISEYIAFDENIL